MSSWAIIAAVGSLVLQQSASVIAPPAPSAPVAETGPPPGFIRFPAAMPIDIEIVDPVGSDISHIDEMFAIRIGAPVMVDGRVVIPSGTVGRAQVVHAAKSGAFGKAGELILAARYIDCGTQRIALRGMRFEAIGKDRADQAFLLTAVVGVPFLFIKGGASLIPSGTHATAKLVAVTDVPAGGCTAPAPPVALSDPTK